MVVQVKAVADNTCLLPWICLFWMVFLFIQLVPVLEMLVCFVLMGGFQRNGNEQKRKKESATTSSRMTSFFGSDGTKMPML